MLPFMLVGIFVASLGILWWLTREDSPSGYKRIPGPLSFPVVGNILQVGSKIHLKFAEWNRKYGDIYQVYLGNRRAVVISDPKLIREAFNDLDFSGREIFEGFELFENDPLGLVTIEGEMWEVHRRFTLRTLRDYGFGKSSMEELILEEAKETIDRIKSFKGKPISEIREIFQVAIVNSLWLIVGSKRFHHEDPEIHRMMNESNEVTQSIMKYAIGLFIPWTRPFLPKIKGLDGVRERGIKFYRDAIKQHEETYQEDSLRDFIDVYIKEMKAQANNPSSKFYGERAERQLIAILADLFFAGNDTTTTTILWAILYSIKFPETQKKLQDEIEKVVGHSRHVTLGDRPNMPYTVAFMEETLRLSAIIGPGLQHKAIVGKEFKGYYIPEKTWIFPNVYGVHRNPKYFEDPHSFKPERFLSPDGKSFVKSDNMLAFQVGKRDCVGQNVARVSFFLFLTNVMQSFTIKFDPSKPEPSVEGQGGILLTPQPYSIILEDRSLK